VLSRNSAMKSLIVEDCFSTPNSFRESLAEDLDVGQ
jgi:hypothetical protein